MSATLKVSLRQEVRRKGASRALRREGFVPGIVYGGEDAPQAVSICAKALGNTLQQISRNHVHTLDIEGQKPQKVLLRDVSLHPVKDTPSHVDFLRVTQGTQVIVTVPLVVKDEVLCPGLKRGGILNMVVQTLEVSVPADNIPEKFTLSLEGKNVGDAIHLSEIGIPAFVKVLRLKSTTTVATIVAPSSSEEPAESTEEGPEQESA